MMSLPPTTLLTLCLLAATLLGAGIGACLWHLRSAALVREALETARRESAAEREALEATLAREREGIALKHAEARDAVARARERAERVQARHDTLAVHAREQGRRIDALEAEVLAYEARHVKLQSDLASDRAGRRRPLDAERASAARRDEDELPVLNRRVRGPESASGFPIGSDLEIPALSESELPEESDELALELLDTRNLFPDNDG